MEARNEGWFDSTPPTTCPEDRTDPFEYGYIHEEEEPDRRHACDVCGRLGLLEPTQYADQTWRVCEFCSVKRICERCGVVGLVADIPFHGDSKRLCLECADAAEGGVI